MELINSLKSVTIPTSFQSMKTSKNTYFSALGAEAKTSVLFLPVSNRMEFCIMIQTLPVPLQTAQIHGRNECSLSQSCLYDPAVQAALVLLLSPLNVAVIVSLGFGTFAQ